MLCRTSIFALTLYTLSASAQYNIGYFPPSSLGPCRARGLTCVDYLSLSCCEAPPSRDVFLEAGVTSSGPPGIVLFHETDITGGCNGCSTTNSINTCIYNVPFEAITVLSPQLLELEEELNPIGIDPFGDLLGCFTLDSGQPQIFPPMSPSKRDVEDDDQTEPGTNENATRQYVVGVPKPTKCGKVNTLELKDRYFRLDSRHHNEDFTHEFVTLNEDEEGEVERFLKKWGVDEFFDADLAAQREDFRRKVGGNLTPKKSRAEAEMLLHDARRAQR